jgi:hypothetical protein
MVDESAVWFVLEEEMVRVGADDGSNESDDGLVRVTVVVFKEMGARRHDERNVGLVMIKSDDHEEWVEWMEI